MNSNINNDKREKIKNDLITRTFPYIEPLDFNKYEIEKPEIFVANIQIETPDDFLTNTKPPRLTLEGENIQKEKILHLLKEAIAREADLIVLPELSMSEDICMELKEKFSDSRSIIIMGSYYDDHSQNCSPILINGELYSQIKNNPSPEERDFMRQAHDIGVFMNTPIRDFAVLICYDATDFQILAALQDCTDFLICIARTQDVTTFRHIFSALTYLQYQYIIFCNDAKYGGSAFYAPFRYNRELDTIGINNETLVYRSFNLMKIDKMRHQAKGKDELFKYPPASVKPRHLPYVEKECRTKEYFKSRSFNYLSRIVREPILNNFLAHVNVSSSITGEGGKGSSSIYRLEDVVLKSIQGMYAPGIPFRAGTFQAVVLKYFLLDLIELLCENDKSLIDKKNKEEIVKRLSNSQDKRYLLFEIDMDIIREALFSTPELLDEIFRIHNIEKDEKLREIPNKLQIKRTELKYS